MLEIKINDQLIYQLKLIQHDKKKNTTARIKRKLAVPDHSHFNMNYI